jgi:arginyl-tRNA--protein-N-Asp/Glu arginylyltransferase
VKGDHVDALPVLRIVPGEPRELVVFDEQHECPYFAGRPARLPLRLPARRLEPEELDERLALGDRRQGPMLYRPSCPDCAACIPLRINVARFEFSRSHRRIYARGMRDFTLELGPPTADPRRIELYNRHKLERGLGDEDSRIEEAGYRAFLGETCCDSYELRMFHKGRLVGVSVFDCGASALSAVYCYYDPDYSRWSLGTLAILREIELCRTIGLKYLYLGLYVQGCDAMTYKARYFPHQERREGEWIWVEDPARRR